MSNFRQLGFLSNVRHLFNKFYDLFLIVMTSIGFVIEILSYNWSIITHQESSTNSIRVFYSFKLINKKANGKFHCCANTPWGATIFRFLSSSTEDRPTMRLHRLTKVNSSPVFLCLISTHTAR